MVLSNEEVLAVRKEYPSGTRVELIKMNEEPYPVESGTKGTVTLVDDIGLIHVDWDNGRGLALVKGVDEFKKISEDS